MPTHIIRALHKQPRLDKFSLNATCSGTREEIEALKMLEGSTKVVELKIHTGWVEDWTKLFPRTPLDELNANFSSDRVLLSKDLIVRLPRLRYLKLDFDLLAEGNTDPSDFHSIKSFPEVNELYLDGWLFHKVTGPNALENRICPAVLQKLSVCHVPQIDRLFNILVRHNVQLKSLKISFPYALDPNALAVGAHRWPAFASFLLQQRSLEELTLYQCEMQTIAIHRCLLYNKASLNWLQLHRHECKPELPYKIKGTFNASVPSGTLRRIRNTCQVLDTLGIDLPILELIAVSSVPFLNPCV